MIPDIDKLDEVKIQELINNEIEESLHFDYKACNALKKNEKC